MDISFDTRELTIIRDLAQAEYNRLDQMTNSEYALDDEDDDYIEGPVSDATEILGEIIVKCKVMLETRDG